MAYVAWLCEGPAGVEAFSDDVEAAVGGGSKENRDGDGEMNDRYWSMTWKYERIRMDPLQVKDVFIQQTCSTSSPVPSRATDAASSSNSALGKGSTKLR